MKLTDAARTAFGSAASVRRSQDVAASSASIASARCVRSFGNSAARLRRRARRPRLRIWLDQRGHRRTLLHRQLAADQVGGLDAGGALVDRRDAGVAQVLRHAGLLDEAHAAMHLDRQRRDLHAELGAPALQHRRQQFDAGLAAGALLGIGMPVGEIHIGRHDVARSARIASIWLFIVSSMRRTSG